MSAPPFQRFRRGTATAAASVTPSAGQIFIDTTVNTLRVGDGSRAGGHPLAKADWSNVSNPNLSALNTGLSLPSGTTAQRPSNTRGGLFRWNSTTSRVEVATDGASTWRALAYEGAASGTAGFTVPSGTTAQRPAGSQRGTIRWNTTLNVPEIGTQTSGVWARFILEGDQSFVAANATRAATAGRADTAGQADSATRAVNSDNADEATRADTCRLADNAQQATSAGTAIRSTVAEGGADQQAFKATRGPSVARPSAGASWYGSTRYNTDTSRYELMDSGGTFRNVLYEGAAFTAPRATTADRGTGTGGFGLSKGTTAQRASGASTGLTRYNTTTNRPEIYTGSPASWKPILVEGDAATANTMTAAGGTGAFGIPVGTSAQRPSSSITPGMVRWNTSERYPEMATTTAGLWARVILSGVKVDSAQTADRGAGTGAFVLTRGTTAQRPSGITGGLRYNATTRRTEISDSTGAWNNIVYEGAPYTAPNATNADRADNADLAARATNADNAGHATTAGTAAGGTGRGAFNLPAGTSAQRPSSTQIGAIRWNTSLGYPEISETNTGAWARIIVSGVKVGTAGLADRALATNVHTFPTVQGQAGDLMVVNAARNGFNLVPQSTISGGGGGSGNAAVENITTDIVQGNTNVRTGTRNVDLVYNHTQDLGRLRNFVIKCEAVTTGTRTMRIQTSTNNVTWTNRNLTDVLHARYVRCVITVRNTSAAPVITSSEMTVVFTTQRESFINVDLSTLGGTTAARIAPLQGAYNSITMISGHATDPRYILQEAAPASPATPQLARIRGTDLQSFGAVAADCTIKSLVIEGLPRMSAAANGNIQLG